MLGLHRQARRAACHEGKPHGSSIFFLFVCAVDSEHVAQDAKGAYLGDRDRGGQNVPNVRGGGNSPRKLSLESFDFLTRKSRIFDRISVEKGQIQGPLKSQNFHPPSNFRRFDPPLSRSSNIS